MRRLMLLALATMALLALACGSDEPADGGRTGITTRTPVAGEATPRPASTPREGATPRPSGGGAPLPGAAPGQAQLEWAAAFCAVTSGFDDAVIAMQDELNPRELEFEERRERAIRRYTAYAIAAETGAELMQQFDAPLDAAGYHEAVIEQFEGLRRLFQVQLERIEAAEAHEDIDAAVQALERDVEEVEAPVRVAGGLLSSETVRALDSMPRCGIIVG